MSDATPAAALYNFFSNAVTGFAAYRETDVPSVAAGYGFDAVFPYLTYVEPFDPDEAREVMIPVNLWGYISKDFSEKSMNDAVLELSRAIGRGGVQIPCKGGAIWLKRGSPFATPMPDDDPKLKRRYVNLTAEYHLTAES